MDLERYIPELSSSSNISKIPGQELAISQQPLNPNQMMNQSHLVTRYQMNQPQVMPTYQLTENPLYQSRSQVCQNSSENSCNEPVIVYHVGGSSSEWKKFTLYFLLFVILITVIINSALIIWIISSVHFSPVSASEAWRARARFYYFFLCFVSLWSQFQISFSESFKKEG